MHDDDVGRVEEEWLRTIETRQSASFEHAFKNGTYVQQQWEPLTSQDGECESSMTRICRGYY